MTSEPASSSDLPARIAEANAAGWREHPRFAGVMMQQLLTSADNNLASVNLVRLPAGRVIGHHTHPVQVETAYILEGQAWLFLGTREVLVTPGQVVAVPMNTEHGLRNTFEQDLVVLAVFTPPMV
jgi:quercetin dioxygenase-like cupin family protein